MKNSKENINGIRKNKKDMISVIVPVYNVEKYLPQCIESILNQTYENFELILIDDGSKDACPKICDEYAIVDRRIKVIHQENAGLSAARNAGLDICNGDYICFVDSDDYIKDNMLQILYDAVEKSNADLAICSVEYVYDDEYIAEYAKETIFPLENEVLDTENAFNRLVSKGWQYVVAWNKLYKKVLFEDIRYPQGLIHEDEMVIHRILGKCSRVVTLNSVLYCYRQRNESIMATPNNIHRLDYFFAISDRIRYFNEKHKSLFLEKQIKRYWGNIIGKYFEISDNPKMKKRFMNNVLKDFRSLLPIILKYYKCSKKEKISIVLFAFHPAIYKKIVKNDKRKVFLCKNGLQ